MRYRIYTVRFPFYLHNVESVKHRSGRYSIKYSVVSALQCTCSTIVLFLDYLHSFESIKQNVKSTKHK
jgi:hypothetical protein